MGLYEIDVFTPHIDTWSGLVARMSAFIQAAKKLTAPGFSPYSIMPPAHACVRHKDHAVRENPHRCDACVGEVSMLVYDVDLGTQQAVDDCYARIAAEGYAQHWYTTHSWRPDAGPLEPSPQRLIIPLDKPVRSVDLPALRLAVLRALQIPADPKKCSGASHFYFLPTCPRGGTGRARTGAGKFLPATRFVKFAPEHLSRPVVVRWQPPPEPTEPVDLEPYRTELRDRAGRWARAQAHKAKAAAIYAILAGEPIGGPGDRNDPMCRTTGVIAWVFPNVPMGTLMALVRPTLRAMQAQGSNLTDAEVEGMFRRAFVGKAAQDARDSELRAWMEADRVEQGAPPTPKREYTEEELVVIRAEARRRIAENTGVAEC